MGLFVRPKFLSNVRFTDLTWAGAGPFGTKVFSDFGADVIKVESATRPDSVRIGGPFRDGKAGTNRSGYFASRNTGKKSITVDLKTEEGRRVVYDIIRRSDVVANNFGPGAMDRIGMSYDVVKAIKSDIIYLSMPMYGDSGPRATLLGVGMTISAVSGLLWSTAYGPGDPVGPGTHYPDHAANPYHAAFAILAALRHRRLTGEGMKIDLSQVESTINFVGPSFVDFVCTGEETQHGNSSPEAAPHGVDRCAGDDAWCAIAAMTDQQWLRLTAVIGRPALAAEPRFASAALRVAARDELDAMVSDWTRRLEPEKAAALLQEAGVPAAIVAHSRYLVEQDPQLAARGYWQRIDHPELGDSLYASPPYKVDGERIELSRPPLLGEHTHQVLSELLGMGDAEITRLENAGALR